MRADKELIKICIDNFDKYFESGLCSLAESLNWNLISIQEQNRLIAIFHKYIKTNTFWNKLLYDKDRISTHKYVLKMCYFWELGQKEPRLRYLQYLYNKLK